MVDALFEHPRLVAVYDALEGDRSDLDAYAAIAEELGARTVLDVGCGTGTFALRLAGMGLQVTGSIRQADRCGTRGAGRVRSGSPGCTATRRPFPRCRSTWPP